VRVNTLTPVPEHPTLIRRCRQSGGRYGPALLEAFTAEYRAALRRPEWNGGFLAALRAGSPGLDFCVMKVLSRRGWSAEHGDALGLAGLAAFGFVLELFVVEEKLLAGGENKVCTAVDTLQHLVLKFH
jgi:hypothetical protein